MVITAALGAALAALSVTVLGSYGWALFVGTPFCLGLVAALAARARLAVGGRSAPRQPRRCSVGVLIVGVALDGGICVLMALPLALPLALAGA